MGQIDTDYEADKQFVELAKALYQECFEQSFPDAWRIFNSIHGITVHEEKVILLSADSLADDFDLESLVHEFVHMRNPTWTHDERFYEAVDAAFETAQQYLERHCRSCGRKED